MTNLNDKMNELADTYEKNLDLHKEDYYSAYKTGFQAAIDHLATLSGGERWWLGKKTITRCMLINGDEKEYENRIAFPVDVLKESIPVITYDAHLALLAKCAKLEELVWKFDDYVVHTRKCSNESYPKCTCGLSELRELRPEYNRGVEK